VSTYRSDRNPGIDFLRGIAILSVLILHFSLAFGFKNSPLGSLLPEWLLKGLTRNGNYGVTLFFVISGFLITSTSLKRWGSLNRIDARAFYLFRFARIMPSLVLALAIIVTLGCLDLPYFSSSDGGRHLPASYFLIAAGSVLSFWHNVLMQSAGYFNYCLNIYWSLSVEEVFYLALPIICLSLRRDWLIAAACGVAIVVGPIYRAQHLDNEIFFMYGYAACFDAIAIGCLAALLARRFTVPARYRRALRYAAIAAIAALFLRGIDGHEIFGFSLMALAGAVFLSAAARGGDSDGGRAGAAPRWLGRHSYELYLFHIIVLALMRNVLTKEQLSYGARLPWFLLFLALSALIAAQVARHVSEPAKAAIRRRYLARADAATEGAGNAVRLPDRP